MRMHVVLVLTTLGLSACTLGEDVVQMTARETAKGVVNNVIAARFPGVDAAPYTDCVIDNASTQELVSLAQGAIAGSDEQAANTVLTIAGRPETSRCLAQSAIGPFGTLLMAG